MRNRRFAPRTLQGYQSIIDAHLKPTFGASRLIDLNARQVQSYYANLIRTGKSAQTVLNIHRLLSQTIRQAIRWDMLSRNIMEGVAPPPRRKPELRSLDVDETRRLLRAAETTDYHMPIYLAIYTGLRRSEILGLRWGDVDLDARRITVARTMINLNGNGAHISEPKSRRSRRVVRHKHGRCESTGLAV